MAPPRSADTDTPLDPKIWQAAQKFEAMAIGQMLAPMFDTVDLSKTKFGGGQGEAAFKPMMIDAIGKQMAAHGGFGLAQPIYAAMLRAQEGRAQQAPAQQGPAQQGSAQAGPAHAVPGQPSLRHAAQQPGKTP
jgi:flagellar protein FlgJ